MKNLDQVLAFVCQSDSSERLFVDSILQFSDNSYRKKALLLHRQLCKKPILRNYFNNKSLYMSFLTQDELLKCAALLKQSYIATKALSSIIKKKSNQKKKSERVLKILALQQLKNEIDKIADNQLIASLENEIQKDLSDINISENYLFTESFTGNNFEMVNNANPVILKLKERIHNNDQMVYIEVHQIRNYLSKLVVDGFMNYIQKKNLRFTQNHF